MLYDKKKENSYVKGLILLLAIIGIPFPSQAEIFSLHYSGRITASDGRPHSGTTDLQITFFDAVTGGNALSSVMTLTNVSLAQGVFNVKIPISLAEAQTIFDSPNGAWIEIKDATKNKIFPRQKFSAVPYALKVPIDNDTLVYNNDGKLEVGTVATATHAITAGTAASANNAVTADSAKNLSNLLGQPVTTGAPSDGQILKFSDTTGRWELSADGGGAGGGETNTVSSAGGTASIYKQKVFENIELRGLTAGSGVSITQNANDIVIGANVVTVAGKSGNVTLDASDIDPTGTRLWLSTADKSKLDGIAIGADMSKSTYDTDNDGKVERSAAADTATSATTAASAITAISATTADSANELNGQPASYYLNAANLTGTIADARVPATIARLTDITASARSSIGATPPIEYNATTGTVSMPAASNSSNGYLSSEHWTLFNNKQDAITSGTSLTVSQIAASTARLNDADSSAYVTLKSPDTLASSYTLTFPANDGNNLDILQTNGSGQLSWVPVPSAPVQSVNGDTGTIVLDASDIAPTASRLWLSAADKSKLDSVNASADMAKSVYDSNNDGKVDHAALADAATSATSATNASNAAALNGQNAAYYLNAANLTGTIADARVPATIARSADIPNLAAPTAIGSTTPAAGTFTQLEASSLKITGGTPGAGKVLTSDANGAASWSDSQTTSLPVGAVQMFAQSTPPSGFLPCNGAAVDRSTYSALFAAIGTTYGAGDGSNTFNLPRCATPPMMVRPTGYQHYRLRIKSMANNGSRVMIRELRLHWDGKWQNNSMTGPALGTIGGHAVTATSATIYSVFYPWRAFDNDEGTYYETSTAFASSAPYDETTTHWLKISFHDQAPVITGYELFSEYAGSSRTGDSYELEGSNDNTNWTVIPGSSLEIETTYNTRIMFDNTAGIYAIKY